MIACLALVLVGNSVSLKLPATPVPTFVERLAKETGRSLAASQEFRNRFVVVKVDDVPAGELMNRLADTFDARWVTEDSKSVLKPDQARMAARQQERFRLRTDAVRKSLRSFSLGEDKPLTPEGVRALLAELDRANLMLRQPGMRIEGHIAGTKAMRRSPIGRFISRIAPPTAC